MTMCVMISNDILAKHNVREFQCANNLSRHNQHALLFV